ncbi:LysR family transcriptional regulator [Nocardia salmonicida]|uniref:LysR family transcriptional regulator n=1 Tax=Nocardia salmonicida TaxID=53431 RepID=UPI002E28B9ED|nr:LysR family transcriptional regulator [Nocardia salmonicida]
MDLRQLEHFVAVAEERNFTRAALRVHVVQSAVSATIKNLERELGVQLLERNSKRVELTDAGRALLPEARTALAAVQQAHDAVGEVKGGLRGTLRIGTVTALALLDLPEVLGRYHRTHPGVALRLSTSPAGSAGLAAAVLEGSLDLAFVSLPGHIPAHIHLHRLAAATLELIVPSAHWLADRAEVNLFELAGESFVDTLVGYGNRTVADQAFATAGLTRQVSIEVADMATVAAFVEQGLGLALLPDFAIPDRANLRRLTITGAELNWPLSLAFSSSRRLGAAARALVTMLASERAPSSMGTCAECSSGRRDGLTATERTTGHEPA